MHRRYATADVFTNTPLSGNPVAVVLDATALTTEQMQALAAEFDYVETTFVLPPADPAHDAHVRIFTPDREVPFAGHPTIGTAFLLARERVRAGRMAPDRLLLEQAAGLVAVDLQHEAGEVVGADVVAPRPLARLAEVDPERVAPCLSLCPDDIRSTLHQPQVLSVGLPFLVVELASREALARCRPNRGAYDGLFPLDGAKAVYAYVRGDASSSLAEGEIAIHARMFTWRLVEDPATGSAAAALAALFTELHDESVVLRIQQGQDLGRPSEIMAQGLLHEAGTLARVGGRCAAVFEGSFHLRDAPADPVTHMDREQGTSAQYLEARYRAYIACLNRQDWSDLARFVATDVRYNGEAIGFDAYRAMLIGNFEDIPDLAFRIGLLVCNNASIAARLVFACSPRGDFMGLPVDGRRISFAENVFYRFEQDRIVEVWSIIDKAAIEAQLADS